MSVKVHDTPFNVGRVADPTDAALVGIRDSFQHQLRRVLGLSEQLPFGVGGDNLYEIALADFLGALPSYVRVSESNAMRVGPVAAGTNTIAGTVGRLPMYAGKGGQRIPPADQPSLLGQLERGVPRQTSLYWLARTLVHQSHAWFNVLERSFYGWPTFGELVQASRLTFGGPNRELTAIDGEGIKEGNKLGRRPQDFIRFDSPLGEGFLANGGRIVQRALAIDLAAAKAEDSPIPVIELHDTQGNELTDAQTTKLLDGWIAARRARGAAYTPKRIETKVHGKPGDALLIDGRRAISLDVIRELNIPAWAASTAVEGATMTYDNRQLRNWELVDLTLSSYFAAIAGRLSLDDMTPHGWAVTFDPDELTRPDMKTRFDTYRVGLGSDAAFIDLDWIAEQESWAKTPAPKEPAA